MHLTGDQRTALGSFIRARREALSPAQFGLSTHGRRRTPGLRREELAQLAGLSTTWCTWLEQGRDVSVSAAALSRLADALALNDAERAYLFELSRHRDPHMSVRPRSDEVPASLWTLLSTVAAPAYVLDRRWDAKCWNQAAGELLRPWLIDGSPNLLRFMFLTPSARTLVADWEERARRLLAEFRAETANATDDPDIAALIDDLRENSTDFCRFWDNQRVLAREGGLRSFSDPGGGTVHAMQITLAPVGDPDHRLVVLLPVESLGEDLPGKEG